MSYLFRLMSFLSDAVDTVMHNYRVPKRYRMAHKRTFQNTEELARSSSAGCFFCLRLFEPKDIVEWCDMGQTAICPHCGIDTVIGSASGFPITYDFMEEMSEIFFKEVRDARRI